MASRLPHTLTVLVAMLLPGVALADTKTGFVTKSYKNADGHESPYVVFVPKDYDGSKPVPVILFLHGSGETKGGSKQPVDVGIGTAVKKQADTFPAIVIVPQSEKRTWSADSEDGKRAVAILEQVQKKYKIDSKRVYLTGLSMGGFGTWSIAAAYPDKWAAMVPICGGGNPKDAEKIKNIPCWCVHGDADPTVKVDQSRRMIDALKKAGATPRYDELPGVGHNSWDAAYGKKELYTWLLEQHRK